MDKRLWFTVRTLGAAVVVVASTILVGRPASAASSNVNNPMSLSNTTSGAQHGAYYFPTWNNRFAIDINSPDEYADAPIFMYGSTDWPTALMMNESVNKPLWEPTWRWTGTSCVSYGGEWSIAMALNLPIGQKAGFGMGHLSNYHVAAGQNVSNGQRVADLSFLSNGVTLYKNSSCTTLHSDGPHIHGETARLSPVINNGQDPISGPSYWPYWWWTY
jgi:hypothetical protein